MSEERRTGAMARVPIKKEGKSNRDREYGSIWRAFWELSGHIKRCCSGGIPSEKMCIVLISEPVRYEQAHAAGRLRDFASTVWAPIEAGISNKQGFRVLQPERCHILSKIALRMHSWDGCRLFKQKKYLSAVAQKP